MRFLPRIGVLWTISKMQTKMPIPKAEPDIDTHKFDSTKIKHFVAMQNIDKVCTARSPNVVVGNSGSGKSLLIGVQQYPGTYYDLDLISCDHVCTSTVEHPKVSNKLVSETLHMNVYMGGNEEMYIDTAGFNDNRGKEEVMWAENNLALLFSCTKQFRSIIIAIDHSRTWPSDRQVNVPWADLSKRVAALVNGKDIHSSVVFAFSRNFNKAGHRVPVATLKNDAEAYIKAMEEQQKLKLCALYQSLKHRSRTLLSSTREGDLDNFDVNTFDVNHVDVAEIRKCIDLSTLAPDDLKFIIDRDAGIYLMKQFQKATEDGIEHHVIVCTPDSERQCEQQCATLNKKIQHCHPFTIDDGQKGSSSDTLSFDTELASIAQEDVEPLRQEKETLKSLLEYKKNNPHLVQALDNNWEVVREERLRRNITFTVNREARKKVLEDDNNRLQASTKSVLIDEKTIRGARKSTWLSYVFLGGGMAEDVYSYEKGQSFIKWDDGLNKNNATSAATPLREDKAQGELVVQFQSKYGHDLYAQVTVQCYEKDHPQTIAQTKLNTEQIKMIEAEVMKANNLKMALKAVHSKKGLESLICAEYTTLKEKQTAQSAKLDKEIPKVSDLPRVSKAQVRNGNYRLLSFMKKEGQLSLEKLSPVGASSVTQFLSLYEEVEQLQKEYFGGVKPATAVPSGDRNAPTNTNWKETLEKGQQHVSDVAGDVSAELAAEFRKCSTYQIGAGGWVGSCALLFSGLGGNYGKLFGIVSLSLSAVAITRAGERTTLSVAQHVAEDKEYVKVLSEGVIKLVDAQGRLTQEMLDNNFQNMIEEIPKDIKVKVVFNPLGW